MIEHPRPLANTRHQALIHQGISAHATAPFVQDGFSGLRRVMPKVADRLLAGMDVNEVTAEVMTALMGAVPQS